MSGRGVSRVKPKQLVVCDGCGKQQANRKLDATEPFAAGCTRCGGLTCVYADRRYHGRDTGPAPPVS